MREDQVDAAAMDLEDRPEELLRHRRAFDVPARTAGPPGRLPNRVLALLVGLPQCEVAGVLLQLGALRLFGRVVQRLLVALPAGEPAVIRKRRDPEVDVAAGRIREPAVDELADQLDDFRNRLGGFWLVVGPAEAEQVGVLDVPLRSLS